MSLATALAAMVCLGLGDNKGTLDELERASPPILR
jgi:hypothetical protein